VARKEDREGGKYVQTELCLDELFEINRKYIAIAAPNFLRMLEGSHEQRTNLMNSIPLSHGLDKKSDTQLNYPPAQILDFRERKII
jgi:hypothetical protein